MGDSGFWSVDRLAANNLLANLKLEVTDDILDIAAEHFAQHRQSSAGWAAKRAHSCIIQKLESAATTYLARERDRETEEWSEGFRYAEQQILTIRPEELLELDQGKTRTKGQVLRTLMRQARNR